MTETVQPYLLPSSKGTVQRVDFCYVTEIDLDRKLGGAITNDFKTINVLEKIVAVDSIYLKMRKYKSVWLAFPLFLSQIIQTASKPYRAYFSRGLFASFSLIILRPLHQKKVIHNALSVPFPSIEVGYSKRNKLSRFVWFSLMRFLERVVLTKSDLIVVADDNYASELVMNGIKQDRILVVPFYIEDKFFQQPLFMGKNEEFIFGYVGGFHPYHILTPVIEAFEYVSKKNNNAKLYLAGEGPLRRDVENEVKVKNLVHKVRFLGELPHLSVPDFLSEVDTFIVLMHKPGIPTSLLEAAAAGKAIITLKRKDDVTLERYFRQGREILYVTDTSPHAIAEAMIRVLEDPRLASTLSRGAREAAQRNFSEAVCLKQLGKLIEKIRCSDSKS